MTHWYLCHDSFICVTRRIRVCAMTRSYEWCDSSVCMAWYIHMRDMTYFYARRDTFICVTWLQNRWCMVRSVKGFVDWHCKYLSEDTLNLSENTFYQRKIEYETTEGFVAWFVDVQTDSSKCVTCLIHVGDMTHSYLCHLTSSPPLMCSTWLIHMCDMTHSDSVACLVYMCDVTHLIWHESSRCATWLLCVTYDMNHSCVTWLVCMIHNMTHS